MVNCGVALWCQKVDGVRDISLLIYFRAAFFCVRMIDTTTVVLLCCSISSAHMLYGGFRSGHN